MRHSGTLKRVGSNFFWSAVSEASTRGVVFVTTIFLARRLGVDGFGLFTVAQTIVFYFWYAVDLGINMYGIREIARKKGSPESIANALLGLRMTTGAAVYALLSVFVYLSGFSHEQRLVAQACGIYLISYGVYTDWVFKGLEKFRYIALGGVVSSFAFLAGVLMFVRTGEDAVLAAMMWSCSYFLGAVGLFVVLRSLGVRVRPEFSLSKWLLHVKESVTFTIPGVLMAVYRTLPILILTVYCTSREVGIFSAPYKIVVTMCSAGALSAMSFYPVSSEMFLTDRERFYALYGKLKLLMHGTGLILSVTGVIFGGRIVSTLLGEQYADSVVVFQLLACMVAAFFIRTTYNTTLMATGYQRWQTAATMTAIFAGAAFCFILMRFNPVVGVSAGAVLAEVVLIIMLMGVARYTYLRRQEGPASAWPQETERVEG